MLDPEITEERREQIAAEARGRIESGGSLKHDTAWGMRKLAYEIEQRTEADYRFFRFETDEGLLDDLNHNLRIADGVLRFRIFKVDPSSPAIVPPAPMATPGGAPSRGPRRQSAASGRESPTEGDAARAPAEATAEPPAEEASVAGEEVAEPSAEEAPPAGEEVAEPAEPESESETRE
jgi:small subunit ribosomal protein S6